MPGPEFLCEWINRMKRITVVLSLRQYFNFRVGNVEFTSIPGGLAEYDVLDTSFQLIKNPGDTLEPDQFDLTGAIPQMNNQSFLSANTHYFLSNNMSFQLNIGHFIIYLLYVVRPRSIFVSKWIMLYQIAIGKD